MSVASMYLALILHSHDSRNGAKISLELSQLGVIPGTGAMGLRDQPKVNFGTIKKRDTGNLLGVFKVAQLIENRLCYSLMLMRVIIIQLRVIISVTGTTGRGSHATNSKGKVR